MMNFWPFNKFGNDNATAEVKNVPQEQPLPRSASQFRTMSLQFAEFRKNNLPADFDEKINKTKPYILASFVSWPLYWGFRGIGWSRHRQTTQLPIYIQKTYLRAKFLQFSIIMLGLSVATLMEFKQNEIVQNISNPTKV